jgi:hypothetical protein
MAGNAEGQSFKRSRNVATGSARRLGAAVAVFALSITVAVGCGTEDISPDTVARAADKTVQAGGARVALDATITEPGGKALPLTGKGVMDPKGERGRIDMDFSSIAAASGERLSKKQATISSLFDRYDIYLGGPALERELPGDKKWIKIDLREVSRELGTEQFTQLNQNDPRKTLDYLRGTGDVEKLGTATVRGASTTHYRATVDLREYANKLPPDQRADAKAELDRANERFGGTNKVTFEVWLDEEGRVRRMKDRCSFPGDGQGKIQVDETVEFFDFGVPVTVEVPPRSEVQDVTEEAAKEAKKEQRTQ